MSARDVGVVIPAGGSGRRMGGLRKQYLELAGEPVLLRALRPFLEHPSVAAVVIALPADDAALPPEWLRDVDERVRLVAGGAERADSVRRALEQVPETIRRVLVHDAARPLVTRQVIDRTLAAVAEGQGAIAAVRIADTVKEVDAQGGIVATRDRSRLWRAQTPQAFPRDLLVAAYRAAAEEGMGATDDAALVERIGGRVVVVDGDVANLKVTTPADVAIAEALLTRGSHQTTGAPAAGGAGSAGSAGAARPAREV